MRDRLGAKRSAPPASAHTKGHAFEGRGFYVWDEDAAWARGMADELGPLAQHPTGSEPRHGSEPQPPRHHLSGS